jgi:hypothetical protein
MQGLSVPNPDSLKQYAVNYGTQREIIWNPLYDYITYAQAGQTSLTFFQNPVGQSSKTYADTNMKLAGQLPYPQAFLMTGLQVELFPDALPGRGGLDPQTAVASNWNDMWEVFESGYLVLTIGDKEYIKEGPLGKFPPSYRLGGTAALTDTTTAAATQLSIVDYAAFCGAPYRVIPFTIPNSQNFNVQLIWPTAVGITAACRIGITLLGYLYRAVQ